MKAVNGLGPVSIRALAAHLGRNYSKVHRDVITLLELRLLARDDLGLEGAPWDAAEIHLAVVGARPDRPHMLRNPQAR